MRTQGPIRTLTIDIGGTGIKLLPLDEEGRSLAERHLEPTPRPSPPGAVLALLQAMIAAQEPFHRVSVGFPGVVKQGVVKTAPNLGTEAWRDFDLRGAIERRVGKPVRVLNDAELQGYGVIDGRGVEIVLTLGTGLGTALYVNGHLLPNLELAHHPLRGGMSYEQLVGDAALKRSGERKWRAQVDLVFETLARIFNYDVLHVGGGNARLLEGPFAENIRPFTNVDGLAGGVRLWQDDAAG